MAFKGTKTVGTKDYAAEAQVLAEIDAAYDELAREKARPAPDAKKVEEKKPDDKKPDDKKVEDKKVDDQTRYGRVWARCSRANAVSIGN